MIAHFDWLPVKGNVVEATEEIILRYTPTWPFAALVERTVPVICWLTATSMDDTAFKAVHDGPRS